jgi:hypothetical protein
LTIKEPDIFALIEKIGDHYQKNIDNQHVRKAFVNLSVPSGTWDLIETLTAKSHMYKYQGYPIQELYDHILAAASFVYHVRQQVIPNLSVLVGRAQPGQEVLIKMVINNFPTNLSIFADMLNELYMKITELDRMNNQPPFYEKTPGLSEIGHFLIG